MRRVTHERYISQSQWVNCDLARRYVGLNLSQQTVTSTSLPITMLPVMGSAIRAVVDAVPRPGASAAERLAASQESAGAIIVISRSRLRQDWVDALDSLLEDRFAALGEPGITRPKDALRFTNSRRPMLSLP